MQLNRGIPLLEQLSQAFGPSGCEGNVADIIKTHLLAYADEVTTDRLGSLIAVYKGSGEPKEGSLVPHRLMLAAHMDEVGFMICSVDDKGYLKPAKLSIDDGKMLVGRSVTVGNEERQIQGYIGTLPAHHSGGKMDFDQLYIDIGAKNKEEAEKYVQPGDFGTFRTTFRKMGGRNPVLKGKAIDNRLGCAILCDILAELCISGFRPAFDTYFVFTRRTEIGASSAGTAAWKIAPDTAIVLEAAPVSDIPGTEQRFWVGKQGRGALISFADKSHIYDRELVDYFLTLAGQKNIPCQLKQYPTGTSDIRFIGPTHIGVRCAAISAPVRYVHSAACVLRESDYTDMYRLVLAAVQNL